MGSNIYLTIWLWSKLQIIATLAYQRNQEMKIYKCGALCDLVSFEKPEKHPWRSATFSKVAGF